MNFNIPSIITDYNSISFITANYKGYQHTLAVEIAVRIFNRTMVAEAQNWKCCYCGITMSSTGNDKDPTTVTLEHVVPLSRGGNDTWDNWAAACGRCNWSKGPRTVDEYQSGKSVTEKTKKYVSDEERLIGLIKTYQDLVSRGGYTNKKTGVNVSANDWLYTIKLTDDMRKKLIDAIQPL